MGLIWPIKAKLTRLKPPLHWAGGTWKHEPLKELLAGWWSRRITKKDRLVYGVTGKAHDQQLEIAQCPFLY